MKSLQALLGTELSGALDPTGALEPLRAMLFATIVPKRRDEKGAITPDDDPEKLPRLIADARDLGRTIKGAPWRSLRLTLHLRANVGLPAGQEAQWVQLLGALERLLHGLNLQAALTSDAWAIWVAMAVPRDAAPLTVQGEVRLKSYPIEIRAVGYEYVQQNTGAQWTADSTTITADDISHTADGS